jgi:hypothetical protein
MASTWRRQHGDIDTAVWHSDIDTTTRRGLTMADRA